MKIDRKNISFLVNCKYTCLLDLDVMFIVLSVHKIIDQQRMNIGNIFGHQFLDFLDLAHFSQIVAKKSCMTLIKVIRYFMGYQTIFDNNGFISDDIDSIYMALHISIFFLTIFEDLPFVLLVLAEIVEHFQIDETKDLKHNDIVLKIDVIFSFDFFDKTVKLANIRRYHFDLLFEIFDLVDPSDQILPKNIDLFEHGQKVLQQSFFDFFFPIQILDIKYELYAFIGGLIQFTVMVLLDLLFQHFQQTLNIGCFK